MLDQLSRIDPRERAAAVPNAVADALVAGRGVAPARAPVGIRLRCRRLRPKRRTSWTRHRSARCSSRLVRRGRDGGLRSRETRSVASKRTDHADQPHASPPGSGGRSVSPATNGPNALAARPFLAISSRGEQPSLENGRISGLQRVDRRAGSVASDCRANAGLRPPSSSFRPNCSEHAEHIALDRRRSCPCAPRPSARHGRAQPGWHKPPQSRTTEHSKTKPILGLRSFFQWTTA